MTSFYKAELPTEPDGWTPASITEGIGGPDQHEDRFWRKGPYGIELDDDGSYEAYVLVADTPFKIGDGFASFADAVGYLTAQMQEKKVDGGEESEGDSEDESKDEAADHLRTGTVMARDKDDGKDTEPTEKSLNGPDATTTIGKSEGFEKEWPGDPAGTDTEEINDAIDDKRGEQILALRDGVSDSLDHLDTLNLPEDVYLYHSKKLYDDSMKDKERIQNEWDSGTIDEELNRGIDRAQSTAAGTRLMNKTYIEPVVKSMDGADDNEGEHEGDVELERPGVLFEQHYVDNHTLGSARIMSDSPSLDAFEKSVGDFRSLMARKNADHGMYCDPGETVEFLKSDESTTYAEMEGFEKAIRSSKIPRSAFTGPNRIGGTEDNPNRGPNKKLAHNRHERENRKGAIVGKGKTGRDLYDRKGWKARNGPASQQDYARWKGNQPVSESEGENISRGPAAQSHWDNASERYRDPERQKERADRMLGKGGWDHSHDNPAPKKDTTGYGRKTPNQPKGTKPIQKSEDFEKREPDWLDDAERFNPGTKRDVEPYKMRDMMGNDIEPEAAPQSDLVIPENPRNLKGPSIEITESAIAKEVEEAAASLAKKRMESEGIAPTEEAYNQYFKDAYKDAQESVMRSNMIGRILDNYDWSGVSDEDRRSVSRDLVNDPYNVGVRLVGPEMLRTMHDNIGRSVYGYPDAEGNDPMPSYTSALPDMDANPWNAPWTIRREEAIAGDVAEADRVEAQRRAEADRARRKQLDETNQAIKDRYSNMADQLGKKDLSAEDRRMALGAKQDQEAADRQVKEQQMTPKQAEQPEQPKQRKPRWSKEQKAAAKAQREQGSAEQPKPDAEQSEQPKAQERPEKQEKPAEGASEPTQKSWDAELASRPFRDMLTFRRSEHDSKRGIAVGTLKEYQKEAAKGTRPIRELYRTVQMGEGSDPKLSSPYDPEVHRTDSTSKKL